MLQTTGSPTRAYSPFPLVEFVPAMIAEDEFAQRLLMGLDHVMGDILRQIDSLPYYLDPTMTTRAMVDYLGYWISASIMPDMNDDEARIAVGLATELNTKRGTVAGLKLWASEVVNGSVQITESGSVTVSDTATDPSTWPAAPSPSLTVRLPGVAMGSEEYERFVEGLGDLVPGTCVVEVQGGPARKAAPPPTDGQNGT